MKINIELTHEDIQRSGFLTALEDLIDSISGSDIQPKQESAHTLAPIPGPASLTPEEKQKYLLSQMMEKTAPPPPPVAPSNIPVAQAAPSTFSYMEPPQSAPQAAPPPVPQVIPQAAPQPPAKDFSYMKPTNGRKRKKAQAAPAPEVSPYSQDVAMLMQRLPKEHLDAVVGQMGVRQIKDLGSPAKEAEFLERLKQAVAYYESHK